MASLLFPFHHRGSVKHRAGFAHAGCAARRCVAKSICFDEMMLACRSLHRDLRMSPSPPVEINASASRLIEAARCHNAARAQERYNVPPHASSSSSPFPHAMLPALMPQHRHDASHHGGIRSPRGGYGALLLRWAAYNGIKHFYAFTLDDDFRYWYYLTAYFRPHKCAFMYASANIADDARAFRVKSYVDDR